MIKISMKRSSRLKNWAMIDQPNPETIHPKKMNYKAIGKGREVKETVAEVVATVKTTGMKKLEKVNTTDKNNSANQWLRAAIPTIAK